MAKITYSKALNTVLDEEMAKDVNLITTGEDIAQFGGSFGVTAGLLAKYGKDRVLDTPIAEATIIGTAVGMALGGLKVCTELMFADFVDCAMDELFNKLGKWRYMHGGELDVPVTVRLPVGIAGGAGPEHSRSTQAQFLNSQGLILAVPSTAYDAMGLFRTALRGKDPVLFFEHKALYGTSGEVPDEDFTIPFGKADIKKEGADVTIVATSLQVLTALEAAGQLEKEGISAEVVDPRTIIPLDKETLIGSVRKTGRLIIVHEEAKTGGTGSEIAAVVAEECLTDMKAPVRRIAAPDVPIAQSFFLEQFYVPKAEQIVGAAKELMSYQ
jgi:pyruvate dehydrogenase E1 component beta subunit